MIYLPHNHRGDCPGRYRPGNAEIIVFEVGGPDDPIEEETTRFNAEPGGHLHNTALRPQQRV